MPAPPSSGAPCAAGGAHSPYVLRFVSPAWPVLATCGVVQLAVRDGLMAGRRRASIAARAVATGIFSSFFHHPSPFLFFSRPRGHAAHELWWLICMLPPALLRWHLRRLQLGVRSVLMLAYHVPDDICRRARWCWQTSTAISVAAKNSTVAFLRQARQGGQQDLLPIAFSSSGLSPCSNL